MTIYFNIMEIYINRLLLIPYKCMGFKILIDIILFNKN